MRNKKSARRILLPKFTMTEMCDETDVGALRVTVSRTTYYRRAKHTPNEAKRWDGKPNWVKHEFNLFPIVLDSFGIPWAEAAIYIMSRIENKHFPSMSTFASVADDLAAYRRYLDERRVDWMEFPINKLTRPTYRFNAYLKISVSAGEMSSLTAKRRMGSVIAFYRWFLDEKIFEAANIPWIERDHLVRFSDRQGFAHTKVIKTTDLVIAAPKQDDPYAGTIEDGAKLRPLSPQEQAYLLDALSSIGNTEMSLVHVFALLTGARIQTILTIRIKDLDLPIPQNPDVDCRLPVGHGTGIDTKFDKQMVLHIPQWFWRQLQVYADSPRGRNRRLRANGGDISSQYLFLSRRGAPFYQSKEDSLRFDPEAHLRHMKSGQAVRQFIGERVVPYVRNVLGISGFYYRFHDLRATAGMNWTDHQLELVERGRITLNDAREYVRVRLGHESAETTDRYLRFRKDLEQVRRIEESHEIYLRELCDAAIKDKK